MQKDEFKVKVSILHKIVLYSTLLIFIAVGISTYLAVKTESKVLKEELIHTASHTAKNIAYSIKHASWSLNWIFVEMMLKESIQYEAHEVIYAKIVKPDREVYLASDRDYYGEKIDSSLLPDQETLLDNYFFPQQKEHGILCIHPITISNERWHIILGLSLKSVKQAINDLIIHNLIWGGLIVLLGIVGSFFLSRSISKPIVKPANAAKITSRGNLDYDAMVKSNDEVRFLSHSFNHMIKNLKVARAELVAYSKTLKERIDERTKEFKHEINECKRTKAKLKQTMAELERSNTELEQFAYIASHDLQEPLRMVVSYMQLLARRYKGKLDSDADEFIAYAVDGATRMQQLIKGLLTYSRVGTSGKDFEPTDCGAVFERTLDNLQKAVEESGANVTHDPLPTVISDRMQLGQLLQNLISNAIRFRSEKQPRIHVSAEKIENSAIRIPQSEIKKGWVFSVSDNGIGIDPEFSERIFIIFQRLHKRREYPGTGIGLAFCKKIVERHGGHIWVESEPGKGSTFYFTIPDRGA